MKKHDVIILGAGLSGLACALTLQKNGIAALLIEPENVVGGRVKSHRTEGGFILDQGFQVLLSSYPELKNFVDLEKLDLKKFNSGALIYNGESLDLLANPVVHPEHLVSTVLQKYISALDKLLVLKLLVIVQTQSSDFPMGKSPTLAFLKGFGFSENFIELFWRPFLAGVYLDSDLSAGSDFFKFLIRCFATGNVSLPAKGMMELPRQMAANLPNESVLLGQTAKSWTAEDVVLADGQKLKAKKVVCTFDASSSPSGALQKTSYQSVETIYFTSPRLNEMPWGKWLVLVPQKLGLGINHFCLLSSVAEGYGQGKPLLSVSIIGNKKLTLSHVQLEMNQIAKQDLKLELIERVHVEKALPWISDEPQGFKVIDGVVHCGDRWASPSINGALRSGRMAAEFILKEFEVVV
jgi:protoporphyrinogen oxidase